MIQKHCFECGTELIEKELENEGIVPYCPKCEQFRFPMLPKVLLDVCLIIIVFVDSFRPKPHQPQRHAVVVFQHLNAVVKPIVTHEAFFR